MQHVEPNNFARCCVKMLRVFGQAFTLALSSKPQIFHVVAVQSTARLCAKMRAARAARLFFLFSVTNVLYERAR